MKKILFCLITLLAALGAQANSFYESCENIPGVTTVYISKAMISLAGDLDVDSGGMNLNSLASKIDGLWVVSAEDKKSAPLKKRALEAFSNKSYEKLMRVNDDNDTVDILMKPLGGGRNECVILAIEPDETTVVIISGTFTLQDIVAASKSKK